MDINEEIIDIRDSKYEKAYSSGLNLHDVKSRNDANVLSGLKGIDDIFNDFIKTRIENINIYNERIKEDQKLLEDTKKVVEAILIKAGWEDIEWKTSKPRQLSTTEKIKVVALKKEVGEFGSLKERKDTW
jgi:hypothetical protein